jgi:hypothetical protein
MRARFFPFSLLRKALQWFYSQPAETVQNWDTLMRAFMKEYYSLYKTQSLCNKIATFAQYPMETILEAFERFNEYTRAVPHHKFSKEDLIQKLYQGLTMASRTIIDASAGGSIIELTPTQAFTLFKKVADNDTWASAKRLLSVQPTGNVKGVLQAEKEDILEGNIDSLMQRLEKMEIEKKEAQDLNAAEARSTCEECGEYGHVHKDCPKEAKVLDYMRKGDLPNFRYRQGRPQFNAISAILNSVPLRIQLKDFMDEQAKINKDTITKFKTIDNVLENIDSKVTEVRSSNHQVLNMMKMLEKQVGQLVGRLSANEGKLPRQPQGPEMAKAIQTCSGKETEDPERSAGARKPKPSVEAEEFAKEEVTEVVTEEPKFEMLGEDMKIPQFRPHYFRGKLDNHFEKFVEVVHRLSINMPLLDALQVPTYSRYFKDILGNKYEIATLGVDHVKMSEQCSVAIANGLEKQGDPGCLMIPCSVGSFKFEKALCDLGASVSVIPRDVFEKLLQPLEPTGMCLELGDNSILYPLGITEDVPVKDRHHFIPVDFVVLEMGERERPPLILGRPFLKTVGATINVGKGEIKFDINGERSSFKFRLCIKAFNMIKVKYIPPHRRVKEEPRKKEEPEKKEVREIK